MIEIIAWVGKIASQFEHVHTVNCLHRRIEKHVENLRQNSEPSIEQSLGAETGSSSAVRQALLTYSQLAQLLNTSEGWVRRNARRTYTRDPIPTVRLGKNVLFDPGSEAFRGWLERRALQRSR